MARRNLDAEWAQQAPVTEEDLTFTFYGETLHRLPEVPLHAFMKLEMDESNATGVVLEAIRECLAADSGKTWDSIVGRHAQGREGEDDYEPPVIGRMEVTLGRVMQVWRYLVEMGTGRPTEPPSDSSDGRSPNGTSSTDTSPSGAVTLPASAPGA